MSTENLYARRMICLATIGGGKEDTRVDQQHEWSDALGELAIGGLVTDPLDVERFLRARVADAEKRLKRGARVGSDVTGQVIPNDFHGKLLRRRPAPSRHGLEPMRQVVG